MPSMKYRPALVAAAIGLVTSLTALPAAAQYRNADAAIKYRQSAMSLQGNHMGRLFAMIKGDVPFDAKVASDNIETIAMLNRLQFAAFIEGSDKGNTRAKPEIWTDKDKFAARVAKSQEDVLKLAAAGKTGNLEQIKTAAGTVGESCKASHDAYQKPQQP